MAKRRQGLSRREYGRHAGISAAYVSALVADSKIPTLADGSLDAVACDLARSQNTVMGRGQRRIRRNAREPISSRSDCLACGDRYSVSVSRYYGTVNALRYCSKQCEADAAAGLTRKQIRGRISRESRG
jgi:hypothetical protein